MIYLDNAATSYPKPPEVIEAVLAALRLAGNPGRSSHASARLAAKNMELARLEIARFLGVEQPQRIVFQPGATQAANLFLQGSLKAGDRVLVSAAEHNAVTRPLSRLAKAGINVEKIPCSTSGVIKLDAAEALLNDGPTAMVICQHGSNVSGAIQPIAELTQLANQSGARIIVDGAQVAGHIPVSLDDLGVDGWFCSGHKGIPGPQGVGILYKRDDFNPAALIAGGTGSGSADWDEDCTLEPECFEVGTPPFALIMGLAAAARCLDDRQVVIESGTTAVFDGDSAAADLACTTNKHERYLTEHLHRGLLDTPGVTVLGPELSSPRLPLVSFVAEQLSPDTIAHHLDVDYGIAVRAGLHCAPNAHEVLGTINTGAVRLSLNDANTIEEIDIALDAINAILKYNSRNSVA
jgi:selenocysteine lyase/cysteine desulfurase